MTSSSNLTREALRVMIGRELRALGREIAAYPDDESLWKIAPGIGNSGGTLTLHLAGNLRHFVGAVLGNSGYVRDREAEFSTRGLSREQLQAEVEAAIADVEGGLKSVDDAGFESAYPLPIADRRLRTSDFLIHLTVHLGYHLGQLDYHRRIITGSSATVDTISVRELPQLG